MSGTIIDARVVTGNKRANSVILELMCSEERHFINHEINKMISDGKKLQAEEPDSIKLLDRNKFG